MEFSTTKMAVNKALCKEILQFVDDSFYPHIGATERDCFRKAWCEECYSINTHSIFYTNGSSCSLTRYRMRHPFPQIKESLQHPPNLHRQAKPQKETKPNLRMPKRNKWGTHHCPISLSWYVIAVFAPCC
jgi:hypothetical protein